MKIRHSQLGIIQKDDYYPFGLTFNSYSSRWNQKKNEYLFSGQLLDKEVNWYEFEARNYMADLGRWTQVDPLAEQSYELTPYRYGFNNPLRMIDPDGRYEKDPYVANIGYGESVISTRLTGANTRTIAPGGFYVADTNGENDNGNGQNGSGTSGWDDGYKI